MHLQSLPSRKTTFHLQIQARQRRTHALRCLSTACCTSLRFRTANEKRRRPDTSLSPTPWHLPRYRPRSKRTDVPSRPRPHASAQTTVIAYFLQGHRRPSCASTTGPRTSFISVAARTAQGRISDSRQYTVRALQKFLPPMIHAVVIDEDAAFTHLHLDTF